MTEALYISLGLVAFNLWLNYVVEPGRILGFIGRWQDRYYDEESDRYAGWLMPFACVVCRTWWLSVCAVIVLAISGLDNPYIYAMPFISHLLIRILVKKLKKLY